MKTPEEIELDAKKAEPNELETNLIDRELKLVSELAEVQVTRQLAKQSNHIITNSIGMKLVLIPKGKFQMGSPIEEKSRYENEVQQGRCENEVQHEVTISKDFYLSVYQVTQSQYKMVMGKNPSYFQGHKSNDVQGDGSNHPVEAVLWDQAVEFCKRLSEFPGEKKAGRLYRLPTEAEWEYACRAGTTTAFSFGESPLSLGDFAWHRENSDQTHMVGEKKPNAWGLYDMHGNVWEWCSDWYGEYPKRAVTDPIGPNVGSKRVLRGGRYFSVAADCRSANRYGGGPWDIYSYIGFRVALSSSGIPM
jgi:formylglycine-generating enzyme required for sulfatase activity